MWRALSNCLKSSPPCVVVYFFMMCGFMIGFTPVLCSAKIYKSKIWDAIKRYIVLTNAIK